MFGSSRYQNPKDLKVFFWGGGTFHHHYWEGEDAGADMGGLKVIFMRLL